MRRFQKEQNENQNQLQQITNTIEKLDKQKFILEEMQKERRTELELLKNADVLEMQCQHKMDTAQEQFAVFETQRDSFKEAVQSAAACRTAYQEAKIQYDSQQEQQVHYRDEWESIQDADTAV